MNTLLPEELLFTLGPIAVLSLALAAVAVSYVFLLIKLNKSEKDKVFLQSKIRDHASEILQQSHEKGLRIIQSATEKAQSILKETQVFTDDTKGQFVSDFQETNKKNQEIMDKKIEQISKMYEQFVVDVKTNTDQQFKIISKDMENHGLASIGEFREALEGERISLHKQLEGKVDEEYKKAQKDIEDYKIDQMRKVDRKVFDILHALIRSVLGRSLTLKDHEDLVQKALSQMKVEMDSEV